MTRRNQANRRYDDAFIANVRELVEQGMTDTQIAKATGVRRENITGLRHRYDIPAGREYRDTHHAQPIERIVSETPERVVYAPDLTDDEPIEDVKRRVLQRTSRRLHKAKIENLALVRLLTDRPVAISISSDWHVSGTGAFDMAGLAAYAEAVRDAPGAYAIVVGDLADNPIKWTKNLESVPDEWRVVGDLLSTFGRKLIGVASGNHDDWSVMFSGCDPLRELARSRQIHHAHDELVWIVELIDPKDATAPDPVPTARYVIATRHKYYRHSNLNPEHAAFRWLEDRTGEWPVGEDGGELVPDILAIGHNHVAVCTERTFKNKGIWGARMGPWQYTSGHGRAGGWRHSPPTAPTFVLWPHRERPIWGTAHYAEALDWLRFARTTEAA